MARTDGVIMMECDRCGRKDFLSGEGDPGIKQWYEVERTASGNVPVRRLLCADCYRDYDGLLKGQDAAFAAFMEKGGDAA